MDLKIEDENKFFFFSSSFLPPSITYHPFFPTNSTSLLIDRELLAGRAQQCVSGHCANTLPDLKISGTF